MNTETTDAPAVNRRPPLLSAEMHQVPRLLHQPGGLFFCRPPGLVRLQPVPGLHIVRVWLPCPGRDSGDAANGEVWRGPCRERARLPLRGVSSAAKAAGGLQIMSEDCGAQARPSRRGRGAGGATGTSPRRLSDGDRLRPPVIVGPDSRALLRLGLPHQQPNENHPAKTLYKILDSVRGVWYTCSSIQYTQDS